MTFELPATVANDVEHDAEGEPPKGAEMFGPWFAWRLLTNTKLAGVTWSDLHTTMSFEEAVQAHDLLDAFTNADVLQHKRQKARMKRR